MPPVEVGVVTATPRDVGLVTELPGRVEASRVAQVRARAAGILQPQRRCSRKAVTSRQAGACSALTQRPTPQQRKRPRQPRQGPGQPRPSQRRWNAIARW